MTVLHQHPVLTYLAAVVLTAVALLVGSASALGLGNYGGGLLVFGALLSPVWAGAVPLGIALDNRQEARRG